VGIDGIDKNQYGQNLESNIKDLITRMKRMAYCPGNVRQVLIPKEGKPGATRPLGISNLEDKIVQKMMQKVLESIYEPTFLDCSFGFRPGLGCHDAIRTLQNYLYKNNVQTIIDIDLKNFFGTIDHKLLEDILKQRVKDPKLMRYINRMFKAGVLSNGELTISDEGVPQGSICSPILANIFANVAIDLWVKEMVIPNCRGKVKLIRYADDAVICCELESDAKRIRESLPKRLAKYKLQLNDEKTKLVAFDGNKANQGIKQETFDFLGFTFYWAKSLRGTYIPKLKTKSKAMRTKLKRVNDWWKQNRNKSKLKDLWKTFTAKLRGHIQYYGVSHNIHRVEQFVKGAVKIAFKWLNKRSQRGSFTWEQFNKFMNLYPLPAIKIRHRLF
jgi:group II intron reverse transcriptase/maturase